MSGYPPYGNPGGGYPPQYGGGNSGYPNQPPGGGFQPPPSGPNFNDNSSCASLYGTAGPASGYNNYPPPPNNPYGGNQMPNPSYGMGGGAGNYPPPPPQSFGGQMPPQQPYGGQMPPQQPYGAQMPSSQFNQPPQQFGAGYGNTPYAQQPPPPGGMNPNYPGSSPYGGGASGSPYPPAQGAFYPQEQPSILYASLEQHQGTIFPAPNFNPETDCQALSHAMQGAGTNERVLIDIATNRSNGQRQHIKHQYKTMFGADLIKHLGGELSGGLKETVTALFEAPGIYEATAIHHALSASKEGTLREILLTRSNVEIRAVSDAYRRIYNKDLQHEISHRVLGKDFKRILVAALQASREELNPQQVQQARQMGIESVIDRNRARQDAEALHKAGAGKIGTDEKTFNAIFTQRSFPHLRAVFEEYQRKYGKTMDHVIRSEFSGDAKDAFLVLTTCIRDRPTFFAERLHKAISGLGTKDSTLIRVIVSRSEIDLQQIKQRYQQLYNRSLAQDVGGDTSGDYKRILMAIIK